MAVNVYAEYCNERLRTCPKPNTVVVKLIYIQCQATTAFSPATNTPLFVLLQIPMECYVS